MVQRSHFYKHGLYAGWREYRHGSAPREIKAPAPIFRGKRRNDVIDAAMDVLRQWRLSTFENEGPVIAGLRSSLCLDGYNWHRADHEAREVVQSAIRMLGYQRPNWYQGQPEYTLVADNCIRCHKPIPDDLVGINRSRFCSDVCASAAMEDRKAADSESCLELYWAALQTVQRSKNPIQKCQRCERPFRPLIKGRKFCSRQCSDLSRVQVKPRNCTNCGKLFHPKDGRRTLCSNACRNEARRTIPDASCLHCSTQFRPRYQNQRYCCQACAVMGKKSYRYEKTCECCGAAFVAHHSKARCCSKACGNFMWKVRNGGMSKKVTPLVTDYLFTQIERQLREAA